MRTSEEEREFLERESQNLDKHIRGLVINLKARGKTHFDLMNLIGCGSSVAQAVWERYGEWK